MLGVCGAVLAALAVLAASPDTTVGYLARQGWFQLELLAGRVPLDEARAAGTFDEKQLAKLDLIPGIQAFGDALGLASSKSYSSINPTWDRTIYNVSACHPVAFRPVRWRFPIVGRVPYLGYFRKQDARRRAQDLDRRGLDVYVRTAGAYSTLGWFADPVLPKMLKWSEGSLANTLFHERAHATLWIPGSVKFNESFANFVGNEAEMRYLLETYGDDSKQVAQERQRREDHARYKELLHATYAALDAVYKDKDLDRGEKLREKGLILAALPTRMAGLELHDSDKYVKSARGSWNNARLVQFKTYNTKEPLFAALLEQQGGDLVAFIEQLEQITRKADDPEQALAEAVGLDVADAE